jgi:hypothetical protein
MEDSLKYIEDDFNILYMEEELKFTFVHGRRPEITLIEKDSMINGYVTCGSKSKINKCSAM